MVVQVVVAIAILAGLVMLRHFAARRVAARQGRFVWLMFLPALLGSGVIFWAAVGMFASAPILAALVALTGAIYLAVLVRFLLRLSRSVTTSGPQDDTTIALMEPLVDYASTVTGLMLIGGLVALVGLIIWGVIQATR